MRWKWIAPLCLPCTLGFTCSSGVMDAPRDDGIPVDRPEGPAPTGTRWEEVEVEDGCGRTGLAFVLVDEVCGGTEDPRYADGFHAPILRDAAMIGADLFAVDASHLWVLDATDPAAVSRRALFAGVGRPLAVAAHGDDLIVATADGALLVVDVAAPEQPGVVDAALVPGPALDVRVEGDLAYVAAGAAGLAIYDLAVEPPALLRTIPIPGWAAAVDVHGGLAYVAACDALVVVDPGSGVVLGQGWLDGARVDGRLVAPAKDVVVRGALALVAAGRFGVVALDVSDPSAPVVLGNCTLAEDLSFYASGVKLDEQGAVVAGGEWGVLPVVDPATSCTSRVEPQLYDAPAAAGDCSEAPPWELVDVDLWEPPPPGHDPVQVLVQGSLVYALGDATRVGMRSVDVHAREPDGALTRAGRWEEPRLARAVAAKAGRVVVAGPAGGAFRRDDALLLVREDVELPLDAEGVAILDDGRFVAATASALHVEGAAEPIALPASSWAPGVAAMGSAVVVPGRRGAAVLDPTTSSLEERRASREAALPPALAVDPAGALVLAAPEWERAERLDEQGAVALPPHGVFDAERILRVEEWRTGLPHRVLAPSARGLVEVASLGGRAGLVVHGPAAAGPAVPLSPGRYVAAQADDAGDRVFLVSADRGRYRSALVTIDLATGAVVETASFTGVAADLAVDGDRLYVADGDRGVRVYDVAASKPALLGVVALGGAR